MRLGTLPESSTRTALMNGAENPVPKPNYDMVDGLVNNQKKNPEKISDTHSNKQTSRNQQDNKPKKRRSVIKRLHQKQIAIARRSGKPIPKYLDQEMERKRG